MFSSNKHKGTTRCSSSASSESSVSVLQHTTQCSVCKVENWTTINPAQTCVVCRKWRHLSCVGAEGVPVRMIALTHTCNDCAVFVGNDTLSTTSFIEETVDEFEMMGEKNQITSNKTIFSEEDNVGIGHVESMEGDNDTDQFDTSTAEFSTITRKRLLNSPSKQSSTIDIRSTWKKTKTEESLQIMYLYDTDEVSMFTSTYNFDLQKNDAYHNDELPSYVELNKMITIHQRQSTFSKLKKVLPNNSSNHFTPNLIPESCLLPMILSSKPNTSVNFDTTQCIKTVLQLHPTNPNTAAAMAMQYFPGQSSTSSIKLIIIPCIKLFFNSLELTTYHNFDQIIDQLYQVQQQLLSINVLLHPFNLAEQLVFESKMKYYDLLSTQLPQINETILNDYQQKKITHIVDIKILPYVVISFYFEKGKSSSTLPTNDIDSLIKFCKQQSTTNSSSNIKQSLKLFLKPSVSNRSIGGFEVEIKSDGKWNEKIGRFSNHNEIKKILVAAFDDCRRADVGNVLWDNLTSIQYIVQPYNHKLSQGEHRFYYVMENGVPVCCSSIITHSQEERTSWSVGSTKSYPGLPKHLIDSKVRKEQKEADFMKQYLHYLFNISAIKSNLQSNQMIRFDVIAIPHPIDSSIIQTIIINEITTSLDIGTFQQFLAHSVNLTWGNNLHNYIKSFAQSSSSHSSKSIQIKQSTSQSLNSNDQSIELKQSNADENDDKIETKEKKRNETEIISISSSSPVSSTTSLATPSSVATTSSSSNAVIGSGTKAEPIQIIKKKSSSCKELMSESDSRKDDSDGDSDGDDKSSGAGGAGGTGPSRSLNFTAFEPTSSSSSQQSEPQERTSSPDQTPSALRFFSNRVSAQRPPTNRAPARPHWLRQIASPMEQLLGPTVRASPFIRAPNIRSPPREVLSRTSSISSSNSSSNSSSSSSSNSTSSNQSIASGSDSTSSEQTKKKRERVTLTSDQQQKFINVILTKNQKTQIELLIKHHCKMITKPKLKSTISPISNNEKTKKSISKLQLVSPSIPSLLTTSPSTATVNNLSNIQSSESLSPSSSASNSASSLMSPPPNRPCRSISSTSSTGTPSTNIAPSYCDLYEITVDWSALQKCCGKDQLLFTSIVDFVQHRFHLLNLNTTMSNLNYLFKQVDGINWKLIPVGSNPKYLIVNNNAICIYCYSLVMGIGSKATINRYKNHVRNKGNGSEKVHGNGASCKQHRGFKSTLCSAALKQHLKRGHDALPDRNAVQLNERGVRELHRNLTSNLLPNDRFYFSLSTVYRTIKQHQIENQTKLRIKQNKEFVTCSICQTLENFSQQIRESTPIDTIKLKEIELQSKNHQIEQRNEREHYYSIVQNALDSPSYSWCFMLDGMDQSKTTMPIRHRQQLSHTTETCYFLPSHITGITMAGPLISSSAFVNFPDYSSDSNLTVEVLHRSFIKCKQLLQDPTINPTNPRFHRRWPLIFNLQADNASSCCKNTVVISYLSILVHHGIFKEVNMSFMIKGHTHDKVDQYFGRIAAALSATNGIKINSFEDYLTVLKESYSTEQNLGERKESTRFSSHVEIIDSVANAAEWAGLANVAALSGISTPHIFRIYKRTHPVTDTLGRSSLVPQTVISTKFLSTSENDSTNEPIVVMEGVPVVLDDPMALPKGPLQYKELLKTVETFQKCGEFATSDVASWHRFLEKHQTEVGLQCATCNQIRAEEYQIGKIRGGNTEEEKKVNSEKTKARSKLKQKMKLHLKSDSAAGQHQVLTNWWNCLPQAGEDVPYIHNVPLEEVEKLNNEFNYLYQTEENNVEMNLSEFHCESDGKLISPSGPLLRPKSGAGSKYIDVRDLMATTPLKKGMVVFVKSSDPDTMLYQFRPAKVLSEVDQRIDPDSGIDQEENQPKYDFIYIQYFDKTNFPKSSNPTYNEFKMRQKQLNEHNIPDDDQLHQQSTHQQPLLLLFSSINSSIDVEAADSQCFTVIQIILPENQNENENNIVISDIVTKIQLLPKSKQVISGVLIASDFNNSNLLFSMVAPIISIILPFLRAAKFINNKTLIFIPHYETSINNELIDELTSNSSISNFTNGKKLKFLYTVQQLSSTERVPLFSSASINSLHSQFPFLLLSFRTGIDAFLPTTRTVPPIPTEKITIFNSGGSIKSNETGDSDYEPSDEQTESDSSDCSESSELSAAVSGDELEEIEDNTPLMDLKKKTKKIKIKQRKNLKSISTSESLTKKFKLNQTSASTTYVPNEPVDVEWEDGEYYPAKIIKQLFSEKTGRPTITTSGGIRFPWYEIEWYWMPEHPIQTRTKVCCRQIRKAIESDTEIEIEIDDHSDSDCHSQSENENENKQNKLRSIKPTRSSTTTTTVNRSSNRTNNSNHTTSTTTHVPVLSVPVQSVPVESINTSNSTSTNKNKPLLYPRITIEQMKHYTWGPEQKSKEERKKIKEAKKNNQLVEPDWEWTDSILLWADWDECFNANNTINNRTLKKIKAALKQT